jgi:cardiolipin synthase
MSIKLGSLTNEVADLAAKAKAAEAKAANAVKNVVASTETVTRDAFAGARAGVSAIANDLAHSDSPYATAHDGFVAFDPSGNVVGGRQPGAVLKDLDVPHSVLDNALGFIAQPESGALSFTMPDGKVVQSQAGSNGEGAVALSTVAGSGVDMKKGGLMQLGVSTPNGRGDTANVLALPKNYDGPVFICDIDDTLRATNPIDLVTGKTQPPIEGAKELLQAVAAQGVPIVYLSAGTSSMHSLNEAFLDQLPKGVLLDRQHLGLAGLNPLNSAQADAQGDYKTEVLDQLKTTFPNVKVFGLGDDKYGDASAYTRAGATAYIHDVKPDHSNLPADFHGTLTPSYTPEFIQKVASDLKAATAQSTSFGGTPRPQNWMQTLSNQLDATTGSKVTQGNSMQLLVDGEQALPQVLAGLDSAKKSICYETYNFLPGDPVAEQVAQHLIDAQKRGVQVRVVVDAVGARELPFHSNPTVQKLIAGGVQVKSYNPIDSISDLDPNRDHRKDVVIDGQTAFIGGMNTSAQWMGGPDVKGRWHDLFSKVQGPATQQIANAFATSWTASGGTPFDVSSLGAPATKPAGDVPMRIITHVPGQDQNIRSAYLGLIDHAQKSINVENSFPMEDDVMDSLCSAARRGVNVRYVVGSDQGLLGDANRTRFQTLLDAGVHVYVYPTRVHTKAMSVDGQVCTIGSSNLDTIALSHNREIINLIQDPKTTAQFDQAVFEKDVVGDPKGQKTLELPRQLHDSIWTRLKDGILNAIWPASLQ